MRFPLPHIVSCYYECHLFKTEFSYCFKYLFFVLIALVNAVLNFDISCCAVSLLKKKNTIIKANVFLDYKTQKKKISFPRSSHFEVLLFDCPFQ